jgi:hypothetical protein
MVRPVKPTLSLLVPLLCCASTAWAEVPAEAPAAAISAPAPAEGPPLRLGARERGIQFAAAAGATLVTVPAGMLLGGALGTLSNDYVRVAPLAVLTWIVLPALAATAAGWWTGNRLLEGSTRFAPAVWVALGTNLLLAVAAIVGGVNAANPLHLSLFSLASALVIPGALTGAWMLWDASPSPAAPPAALLETGRPRPMPLASATVWEVAL